MNGAQFGALALLQVVVIIMLWIMIDDLGDVRIAVKSINRNTALFFNDLDRRSGPPWPVVIERR